MEETGLNCSLSGLGSSGVSSNTCVGRAAKLRWVKTRVSISDDSTLGRNGRPPGPKSGLDHKGERGRRGGQTMSATLRLMRG
jgi:hypothetical protein